VTPPVVPPVTPPPVAPPGTPPFISPLPIPYPVATPLPDLPLDLVDRGVRMPAYEAPPIAPPVEEALAPSPPVWVAPPVPVYVRKQDRN
jgi:hypothetical protein